MKLKPVVASLCMLGLLAPVFAKGSLVAQQAVIDQNSPITPLCTEGWTNRISVGGMGSIVANVGNHDPAGFFTAINNSSDLYVNNFNLLINAKLSSWSKVSANIAYLGAPIPWNNMQSTGRGQTEQVWRPGEERPTRVAVADSQWSYRRIKHSIVADEAYVTIGDLAKYPFYFVVGKKYVPFGDYTDPYTPYQIMSPTQMLSQTNAVTAIVGLSTNFGLYGSLYALKGETYPVGSSTGNIRNFGAKIGYYDHLDTFNIPNAHVNFALSYIHNLWDNEIFTPNPETKYEWLEKIGVNNNNDGAVKINHPVTVSADKEYGIDPVDGISLHADLAYKAFSMSANFVSAIKKMVDTNYSTKADSSKFWAADVKADYAFKTLDRESQLGAGIQWTGNGSWFGDNVKGITDWCRIIPKWRLLGEYKINLFKNTDLDLVVAHGKSYDFVSTDYVDGGRRPVNVSGNPDTEPKGSRNTTVGLARLMVQF